MASRVLTGGAIKVDILGDNSQYKRAMEQARTRLRSFQLYARRVSRQIRGYWKAIAAAIGGAAASVGVGVRQMVAYSSRLIEASRAANVTTRSLENIRALFAGDGLGTEKATRAVVELNRRLGEAQLGTGTAKRALDELGISLTTAEGNAKSTEMVFFEVANALQRVETDSLAAQLAYDLLGRDGKEIAAIFRNLTGDVRETADEMGRFRTVSEEQHKANKDLGQSFEEWRTAAADLIQRVLSPMASTLEGILKDWTDWIQELKNSPQAMKRLEDTFISIAESMKTFSDAIRVAFDLLQKADDWARGQGSMNALLDQWEPTQANVRREQAKLLEYEAAANAARDRYIDEKEKYEGNIFLGLTGTTFEESAYGQELLTEFESAIIKAKNQEKIALSYFEQFMDLQKEIRKLAGEDDGGNIVEKGLNAFERLLGMSPQDRIAPSINPHLDHFLERMLTPIAPSTNPHLELFTRDLIARRSVGLDPEMAFGRDIQFPSRPSRPNPYALDFIDRGHILKVPTKKEIADLVAYANGLQKKAIIELQKERIRVAGTPLPFTLVGDPASEGILPVFGTSQDSSRGAKERMMQQHNERLMALKPVYARWGKELIMDFDEGIGPLGHTITKAELKWEAMRKAFREADRGSVESLWAYQNAQELKWQAQRTAFREADLASLANIPGEMDVGRAEGPHRVPMWRLENAQPIDDNSPYRIGNLTNMSGDAYQGRVYGPDTDWQQMTSVATEKWLDELEKNKDKVKKNTNEMRNAFDQMGSSIVDNFENAGEALRQFARDIVKIGWQRLILNPVGDYLFGAADGKSGSGLLGGMFNSFFPAKADGGMASGLTLVGERGPELVDFSSPAMVTSNEKIRAALGAGGMGASITIINNIDSTDGPGVERALAEAMPTITAAAEARVLDSSSRYGTARKMLRG